MIQPDHAIVRTPKTHVSCLAIELRRIPDDVAPNLHKLIREYAERWAYQHEHQLPATLWMKEEWSGSGGHPEYRLACSSKMPHFFLKGLADELSQWVDKGLRFTAKVLVDPSDDWSPLFHWQDGKAWDAADLADWDARDQSPVPHEPPSPSEGGYEFFRPTSRTYSEQELNTRAFNAARESADKEDLGEYLSAHRSILRDASAYAKGHTPLHLAAAAGDLEACSALLEYVSSDVLSEHHKTPLIHLADVRGKHNYAAIVSRLSSTVDHADLKGRTALMYAARGAFVRSRKGHLSLVKALLNAGADVTATDADGRTALGWAMKDLALAKPDANADVIDCLQRHQYQVEVERFFRSHYNHHFDANGVMHISPIGGSLTTSVLDLPKVLPDVIE